MHIYKYCTTENCKLRVSITYTAHFVPTVGTVIGCRDIPPYVTIVPPSLQQHTKYATAKSHILQFRLLTQGV